MLDILYTDDYLAIVHKPAGWLVHRTPLDKGETRFVLQALRDQLGRKVWPLHRLDKGTSGVLAFALDAQTARSMGLRFESGEGLHKTYRAIAEHIGFNRLWLHALRLELPHPVHNAALHIQAPLPPDWELWLPLVRAET